jgi:hypothetical protein
LTLRLPERRLQFRRYVAIAKIPADLEYVLPIRDAAIAGLRQALADDDSRQR